MAAPLTSSEHKPHMVDILIVGQGIAGSLLAWVLHQRGLRVLVVDDGHKSSASLVAAGMINPIQGKRLNTIWEIEHCLPAAIALYRELESRFGQSFFVCKKIVRLLKDAEQAAILQIRLADPAFAPYLGAVHPGSNPDDHTTTSRNNAASSSNANATASRNNAASSPNANATASRNNAASSSNANATASGNNAASSPDSHTTDRGNNAVGSTDTPSGNGNANALHAPFGSFEIIGGGYLDTQSLLRVLRDFFRTEGLLVEASFAYADLDLSDPSRVGWQTHSARRIVFAEGWRTLHNPFFATQRFIPSKGQILAVRAAQVLPDYVINRGKWLVPQGRQEAWIGATFERGLTDALPTEQAMREIIDEVQGCIPANPLSVCGQRAGVRLAAPDHIPRVGFLPTEPRIGIFGAFSSKANCLAPYLAHCMAEHILHKTPLPAQVARVG